MKLPEGFETIFQEIAQSIQVDISDGYMTNDTTCIWLRKAMYGLVQVAQSWYRLFINTLTTGLKCEQCGADPCFLKWDQEHSSMETGASGLIFSTVYIFIYTSRV